MKTVNENINNEVSNLTRDTKALNALLLHEKEKRKLTKNDLLFLRMSDIAQFHWCAMKSLFISRQHEIENYAVYLNDRIIYSYKLGIITKFPKNDNELSIVGDSIKFEQIEELLNKQNEFERNPITPELSASVGVDKNGNRVMVLSPKLSQEEVQYFVNKSKQDNIRIVSIEDAPPMMRGTLLENEKAERYPTIRWNFSWDKYILIGVPDGITNDFIYEYKTTGSKFLMIFLKPVAFSQADLYGHYFKRKKKRVQIYIVNENATQSWDADIDHGEVESVQNNFHLLEQGNIPGPPKKWKCKSCEFIRICSIKQQ